jgi:hypothetical protein
MPWHPAGVFLGEKMDKIASALVKAQKAFGPALKTATNPHFRSRYADLSACVEAVIEGLNGAGIALVQRTSADTIGVTVETVFIHESGEMLECGKLHVPAVKHDAQGFGSALTYARRYSLMAACGIAPEDDDGNAAARKGPKPDITDHLAAIEATTTGEELQAVYKQAYEACQGHQDLIKRVIDAKAARVARAKQEKQA